MFRRDLLKNAALMGVVSILPARAIAESLNGSAMLALSNGSNKAPMNAANLTPALDTVLEAQSRFSQILNQDVSFIHRRSFIKKHVDYARDLLARFVGVDDENSIALVRNTSEANSIIVNGVDFAAGDEVLGWNQNHATNRQSWKYRQQREGKFSYKEVALNDTSSTEAIVKTFVNALSDKTRVVTFSHISNISGLRMPARELCEAVHEFNPDILVHIDGAQSVGCINVNIDEIGCDSFSASCHKWMMGPRGTGFLFVKDKWAKRIWPGTLGYEFLFDYPLDALPETAERFECLGQRDVAAYAAIAESIKAIKGIGGISKVEKTISELTHYTQTSLEKLGVRCVLELGQAHGVVVADLGGSLNAYGAFLALHNEGIASAFIDSGDVCCDAKNIDEDKPDVYLRLSPHVYNSRSDIDRAVAVIQRIRESKFEILKEAIRFI